MMEEEAGNRNIETLPCIRDAVHGRGHTLCTLFHTLSPNHMHAVSKIYNLATAFLPQCSHNNAPPIQHFHDGW